MRHVDETRAELRLVEEAIAEREHRLVLAGVAGSNERERKAALFVALTDDDQYIDFSNRQIVLTAQLRGHERDVVIYTERCRYYRAALALHAKERV